MNKIYTDEDIFKLLSEVERVELKEVTYHYSDDCRDGFQVNKNFKEYKRTYKKMDYKEFIISLNEEQREFFTTLRKELSKSKREMRRKVNDILLESDITEQFNREREYNDLDDKLFNLIWGDKE